MTATVRAVLLAALLLTGLSFTSSATAQSRLRYGAGFGLLLSTEDGFGINLEGRGSYPVNQDLSVALDVGLDSYIFKGTENATYNLTPQLSAIINLPQQGDRVPYILAGVGAHIALSDGTNSGPTLHGGYGWVQLLHNSALFVELDPSLVIGKSSIDFVIPLRLGLIF